MSIAPTAQKSSLKSVQASLAKPIAYAKFLENLGGKGRQNAENHVAACDAEATPGHGKLWRRVACTLMSLSSNLANVNGQQSVQFYVPDGKYRKQVFALEDLREQNLTIYCIDVLDEAIKLKVLTPVKGEQPDLYKLGKSADTLVVERIDGSTTNTAEFYKHMVGWNRKAIRITLPITASEAQVDAVLTVCALSMANGG